MSVRHTEIMARIGLAGAIVPTYCDKVKRPGSKVQKILNKLEQNTTAAIRFFGRVGAENMALIGDKIDKMKEESCLGKPRSILTFIDFSVEILEKSISGKDSVGNYRGVRGRIYIKAIIDALVELRLECAGSKNFEICSIAGIRAAEVWERV